MKNLLLLLFAFFAFSFAEAQSTNLIFFTEQGERFSVILNGILQNEKPETNIKITDLPAPSYKLKVIFEDEKLPQLDKTLYFNQGTETTFTIKRNNKNEYVVRFLNEVAILQAPRQAPAQRVVVYHTEPATTTTTTTVTSPGGTGVGLNVTDPYSGANINVNMNLGGVATQTTTTTTTTTSGSGYQDVEYRERVVIQDDNYQHPRHDGQGERYEMQGYNGEYGCPWPMSPADFADARNTISSKSFEDSKLAIAKQIIQSNCLLSSQVKELMLLFTFEETRLDFAKFAYGYTLDLGNYYKVNDAFTFESSIEELDSYIQGFRR